MPPAPSFADDIRALFTDEDVDHMSFKFDLSDYNDVKAFADDILDRVTRDKNDPQRMPKAPREPWTSEMIQLFRDWIAGGSQP